MWLSLGPLQDPFRGKNTFNYEWSGGISTSASLLDIETILSQARPNDGLARPNQSIQWRVFNGRTVCVVAARNDELGKVYDAVTGKALEELTPEAAGKAAQQLMAGSPSFDYRAKTTYYYNDLNRKISAYHFRFSDVSATDVFISKTTGDVISRRTTFWRAFSPILMLYTYAFTDNVIADTILLSVFQIGLFVLIFTGWRLNFSTKSKKIEEDLPNEIDRHFGSGSSS